MSVLIKGMEMPKRCVECRLATKTDFDSCPFCNVTMRDLTKDDWWYEHPSDCPLVHVPPHGDLIDRNKLYDKTAEWETQALHMVEVTMNHEDTTEWRKWSTVLTERSAFKFDVADAPTIIPASEEGE